jgi:N-acetylmuramic acid 6-phosphate etherase
MGDAFGEGIKWVPGFRCKVSRQTGRETQFGWRRTETESQKPKRKSVTPNTRKSVTERVNPASDSLDTKSTREILRIINREDHRVAPAVRKTLPHIARAVDLAVDSIRNGGRLIYLGSGTSGRLGVLDAAESVPTFGTESIIAILAGAPASLADSVEGVEDNSEQAVRDLKRIRLRRNDLLVGISASGSAPYVLGGMKYARKVRASVVGLSCNPVAALKSLADVAIIPVVGPEVIAGSSRMKAGTAQKLVLNMLSTATMVRLGYVLSSSMINLQPTNQKLRKRAEGILKMFTSASPASVAKALKDSHRNLPVALLMVLENITRSQAARLIKQAPNVARALRKALEEKLQGQASCLRSVREPTGDATT